MLSELELVDVCSLPALTGRRHGYVVSPGYPHRYPPAVRNCSVTVVVSSTSVIVIRALDLFLASYTNNNRRKCFDRSAPHSLVLVLYSFLFFKFLNVKMLTVIAIIVSKMTSHCAGTVQMREESESGIRK